MDQKLAQNIEENDTPVLQPLEEVKANQLIELFKRTNTKQFCNLKCGANFGISIEAQVFVKEKIFCSNGDFSQFSVEDVNNLSLYIDWAILRIENL